MTAVQQPEMSHRNRARANRSGADCAAAMRGHPNPNAAEEVQQPPRRPARKDGNFANHMEFLAGPQKPGKIQRGVRRSDVHEVDHVGHMLTDEFLMSGSNTKTKAEIPKQARTHLTFACYPTEEPPAYRPTLNMDHTPARNLDAPYFEVNDPKPPREAAPVSGRKQVKQIHKANKVIIAPGEKDPNYDYSTRTAHKNKANESVNVTNLGIYTPEQLNEMQPTQRHLGVPAFIAPDMPPRRRPAFHQVKTSAKDEHDVLGTGRCGHPETEKSVGKAHGTCKPPRESNIFAATPNAQQQVAPAPAQTLLRYYDPKVDGPMDTTHTARLNRTNQESKYEEPRKTGKGKGSCAIKSNASHNIW